MRTRFGELILGPLQTRPTGETYRCVHVLDLDREDIRTLCGNRPSENINIAKGQMWIPYEDADSCDCDVLRCTLCYSVQ